MDWSTLEPNLNVTYFRLDGETGLHHLHGNRRTHALPNGTHRHPVVSRRPVLMGKGAISLDGQLDLGFFSACETTRSPGANVPPDSCFCQITRYPLLRVKSPSISR
jgi:hypothetical protein